MTVISTFIAQVKPGRWEDVLALSRSSAKALERLGAHNVRALRGVASADTYGGYVMSMEFENNEVWGDFYDRVLGDDEMISMISQSDAESSPYSSQSVVVASEIPLGCPTANGRVIGTTVSKPLPGGFEDAITLSARVGALFTSLGAVGSRLLWLGSAGSQAGSLVLTCEYTNMRAMGKAADAFLADSEGQAIIDVAFGVDSPVTVLSEEIYQEMQL